MSATLDMPKRFLVALSFPGELRSFVSEIAQQLSRDFSEDRVLYDSFHEAEFARPNLDTHLQALYHNESELVVVFLSGDYDRKEWPGLEWRAIRDLIKARQDESILLVRLDDAPIRGLFSLDGYVDAKDRDVATVVRSIHRRLHLHGISGIVSAQPESGAHTPHWHTKWRILFLISVALLIPSGYLFRRISQQVNTNLLGLTKSVSPAKQPLSGQILENGTGKPLAGVLVILPQLNLEQTTNQQGVFRFEVPLEPETRIKLRAYLAGYKPINTDLLTGIDFMTTHHMRRNEP